MLAYQAGNTRTGDLAAKKALSLSDKDLRANLKSQLDQAKQQSAAAAASSATPSRHGDSEGFLEEEVGRQVAR